MTLARTAERIRRLADTLLELKDRVRQAVATEAGRAVGEAIRDLLTTALSGREEPRRFQPSWSHSSRNWDDIEDEDRYLRYHADRDWSRTEPDWDDEEFATRPPASTSATWITLTSVAAAALRCWFTRTVPSWLVGGAVAVAGLTAVVGGPMARAGLALVTAAIELVPFTTPIDVP